MNMKLLVELVLAILATEGVLKLSRTKKGEDKVLRIIYQIQCFLSAMMVWFLIALLERLIIG